MGFFSLCKYFGAFTLFRGFPSPVPRRRIKIDIFISNFIIVCICIFAIWTISNWKYNQNQQPTFYTAITF